MASQAPDPKSQQQQQQQPKAAKTQIVMRTLEPPPSDEFSAEPTFDVSYGKPRNMELLQKNPLVPAGAILTGGVLLGGLFAFKRGNVRLSQQLMRARVLAQGATLCVLGASVANATR